MEKYSLEGTMMSEKKNARNEDLSLAEERDIKGGARIFFSLLFHSALRRQSILIFSLTLVSVSIRF